MPPRRLGLARLQRRHAVAIPRRDISCDLACRISFLRHVGDFLIIRARIIFGQGDQHPAIVERVVEIDFLIRLNKLRPKVGDLFDIGSEPG